MCGAPLLLSPVLTHAPVQATTLILQFLSSLALSKTLRARPPTSSPTPLSLKRDPSLQTQSSTNRGSQFLLSISSLLLQTIVASIQTPLRTLSSGTTPRKGEEGDSTPTMKGTVINHLLSTQTILSTLLP